MKRLLFIAIALMLYLPVYASVGVQEDGTQEGIVTDLNASTGLDMSVSGSVGSISLDQTTDLTFNTTLTAIGRVNTFSTVASSSTNLAPSSLPYSVLYKYVGGNNAKDELDGGTRLPNGTKGQILVCIIAGLSTNGSWIITPVTSKTVNTITMDTAGDSVTLLYVDDTIGWEVLDNTGCTIVRNVLTGIGPY